ncbi:acyltransferase [Dysgonomonas sp. 520]|uniref:acyltransferase n=1 Tax=Dysgonomonas sp. 520 TaxID=2302931 RepID=UPI0013D396D8|nr:acyltransferase [Dysgonomonas sp. 520]NDW09207.1 acyltransferase [Dysgonomonas sp. 520]
MIKRIFNKIFGIKPKEEPPEYLKYIENEGSILRYGFNARLDNPVEGRKYMNFGKDSILDCNLVFESDKGYISIGDSCIIGHSTFISRKEIIIEDHVLISWGCLISDNNSHSLDYKNRREDHQNMLKDVLDHKNPNYSKNWDTVESKPIRVCSDAWIGMNCIIMKGVTIGRGAVVGANSVVTKDVPDFTVVAGNPAKIIKNLPQEYTY